MIRGGCLCGSVRYEIDGRISAICSTRIREADRCATSS